MDNASLLNELKEVRNLSTPEEEVRFYNAVDQLEYHDNSLLPDILYIFKDDVANPDPFKDLANRVATLDHALVIKYFVEGAPALISAAQDWMFLICYSLLGENMSAEWINQLRKSSPSAQAAVFALFDQIMTETLEHLTNTRRTPSVQITKMEKEILRTLTLIREAFHRE